MPKFKDAFKSGLFRLSPALAARCGVQFPLRAPNRAFLEQQIFDYLNQQADGPQGPGRCLFLGMGEYTWHLSLIHISIGPPVLLARRTSSALSRASARLKAG